LGIALAGFSKSVELPDDRDKPGWKKYSVEKVAGADHVPQRFTANPKDARCNAQLPHTLPEVICLHDQREDQNAEGVNITFKLRISRLHS
jgi:hypothetical protein